MPRRPSVDYFLMMSGPPGDLRWDVLERTSLLTFTEPQRSVLADSMDLYLRSFAEQRSTKKKDIKRHLERLDACTRKLIGLLSPYQRNKPPINKQMNLHRAILEMFPQDFDRDGLMRELSKLRHNAQSALTQIPKGQPGQPANEALHILIHAWYGVYLQAGGPVPGYTRSRLSSTAKGQFLELVDGAFHQVISEEIRLSRDALVQQMGFALKTRKSSHDAR